MFWRKKWLSLTNKWEQDKFYILNADILETTKTNIHAGPWVHMFTVAVPRSMDSKQRGIRFRGKQRKKEKDTISKIDWHRKAPSKAGIEKESRIMGAV